MLKLKPNHLRKDTTFAVVRIYYCKASMGKKKLSFTSNNFTKLHGEKNCSSYIERIVLLKK